jgi:pimeloyl-ACP methyl ester carboxylesterase
MKVYFISGLAADSRVFKNIVLPEGFEMVHLDWIAPIQKESLGSYSARLATRITPGEKFALIGVSMGGMIASEIAKQFNVPGKHRPVITILLSSVPIHKHLPAHLKVAGFLKLYKLMPTGILKSATVLKRFFTSNTAEDKAIISQLVKESDPAFIKWAIPAILHWKNEKIPQPLLHIHGTKDRTLPIRYTRPTHVIKRGCHVMVMNRAEEVNQLIKEALLSLPQ